MPGRRTDLPLCRSEFLQDVIIAMGRWRKGLTYHLAEPECKVAEDEGEVFR